MELTLLDSFTSFHANPSRKSYSHNLKTVDRKGDAKALRYRSANRE